MIWIMDEWAHLPLDQHHSHVIIFINFKNLNSWCKYIVTPLHHIILSNYPTNKWHGLAQHWAVDSWHDGWWLHVLPPMPIIQITHPIMDFLNNLDTGMQFLHRYLLSKCDIAQQNEIIICLVSIKCFHILLRSNI